MNVAFNEIKTFPMISNVKIDPNVRNFSTPCLPSTFIKKKKKGNLDISIFNFFKEFKFNPPSSIEFLKHITFSQI